MITGTLVERDLSDASTGVTRFILLNKRTPGGYTWSGVRLTRKQTTSRPDNSICLMHRYAKQSKNGSSRNQSSIMPDNNAVASSLNQIINPTWKILMKDVDLVKPTTFLDHVYLGCTQRECLISKGIVDNYRYMFKSRNSAGAMEKFPEKKATEKPDAETISSCTYDVEGHAKKFVE